MRYKESQYTFSSPSNLLRKTPKEAGQGTREKKKSLICHTTYKKENRKVVKGMNKTRIRPEINLNSNTRENVLMRKEKSKVGKNKKREV